MCIEAVFNIDKAFNAKMNHIAFLPFGQTIKTPLFDRRPILI